MSALPSYWTMQRVPGGLTLCYAVRGGVMPAVVTVMGGALILFCLYSVGWLVQGWFGPDGEVLVGLHSPEEARWFGPLFAKWAGVRIKRDHATAFVEANPDELPEL